MNIQTYLTRFRAIFKQKQSKIGKNTEGVIDNPLTQYIIEINQKA
jgi:hypothetical protein